MKKFFQIIGLISLTCFSFFITEKTAIVVNDLDEIMIEIRNNKEKYKTEYKDAIIDGNTIIPGIRGREVNINKSYKNMKINGYYNSKLFIYDYESPSISLEDNLDKYIIKGNPEKRMVSLIFKVTDNTYLLEMLNIINNYNIKAAFFVNYNWFVNNGDLVEKLIKSGHTVGTLFDDYSNSNYELMNIVLKKVNKQKFNFCYSEIENDSNLELCASSGNYTIKPTIISGNTPLVDIKSKLEAGSVLSLPINSEVKKQLSTIIIYIKSKGYSITNLEDNVLE